LYFAFQLKRHLFSRDTPAIAYSFASRRHATIRFQTISKPLIVDSHYFRAIAAQAQADILSPLS